MKCLFKILLYQVINPKLSEIASRCDNFGGNKSGRWGYRSSFRGRENSGPRAHMRFGGGGGNAGKTNGYAAPKTNGYANGGKLLS